MIKEKRPWGEFKIIHKEPGITIKIISVKPNSRLSLQSHQERDEHWLLLMGQGSCQITDNNLTLNREALYLIPRGTKHRLSAGKERCRVLEISFGKFNEKDIIRYEDDYGRIKSQQ